MTHPILYQSLEKEKEKEARGAAVARGVAARGPRDPVPQIPLLPRDRRRFTIRRDRIPHQNHRLEYEDS